MTEEELRAIIRNLLRRTWDSGQDPEKGIEDKPKRGIGAGLMRKRRRATEHYLDKTMAAVQAFNNGRQP